MASIAPSAAPSRLDSPTCRKTLRLPIDKGLSLLDCCPHRLGGNAGFDEPRSEQMHREPVSGRRLRQWSRAIARLSPIAGLVVVALGLFAGACDAAQDTRELVIVDPSVPGVDLVMAAASSRDGTCREVVALDPRQDGVDQITRLLSDRHQLRALYIVSHGFPGGVILGASLLDRRRLTTRAAEIAGWRRALAPGADLLLYGCDVGAGAEGRAFLESLGRLSGADVAASTDRTGDTRQGGDWILERRTGEIEARAPFDTRFEASWRGLASRYRLSAAAGSSTPTRRWAGCWARTPRAFRACRSAIAWPRAIF